MRSPADKCRQRQLTENQFQVAHPRGSFPPGNKSSASAAPDNLDRQGLGYDPATLDAKRRLNGTREKGDGVHLRSIWSVKVHCPLFRVVGPVMCWYVRSRYVRRGNSWPRPSWHGLGSPWHHGQLATLPCASGAMNFKHLVHLDKIRMFNAVNLRLGYPIVEIRSPKEYV